MNEESYKEIRR